MNVEPLETAFVYKPKVLRFYVALFLSVQALRVENYRPVFKYMFPSKHVTQLALEAVASATYKPLTRPLPMRHDAWYSFPEMSKVAT